MRDRVCHICCTGEVSWTGQQMTKPPYFRRTLVLSNVEIVFISHSLVTLLRYFDLLSSCPALFAAYFKGLDPYGGKASASVDMVSGLSQGRV